MGKAPLAYNADAAIINNRVLRKVKKVIKIILTRLCSDFAVLLSRATRLLAEAEKSLKKFKIYQYEIRPRNKHEKLHTNHRFGNPRRIED